MSAWLASAAAMEPNEEPVQASRVPSSRPSAAGHESVGAPGGALGGDALFAQLAAFVFDEPGDRLAFTARLAHENGWTRAQARRVVDEYRRFVWLAMRAGHPVTPSPAVDEAWHLHLCYTRSYWDRLCGQVLGHPLHHEPTRGGAREDGKFADWYARTLASYRARFGEPPADIWPAPDERFRGGIPRKVDAARHWVIERARVRRAAVVAALATVALALGGCAGQTDEAALLTGLGLMVGVGVLVALIVRSLGRSRQDGCGSGCGGGGGCGQASGCGSGRHDGASDGDGGGGDGGDGGGGGCGGD